MGKQRFKMKPNQHAKTHDRLVLCDGCGFEFPRSKLLERDGALLCPSCLKDLLMPSPDCELEPGEEQYPF